MAELSGLIVSAFVIFTTLVFFGAALGGGR